MQERHQSLYYSNLHDPRVLLLRIRREVQMPFRSVRNRLFYDTEIERRVEAYIRTNSMLSGLTPSPMTNPTPSWREGVTTNKEE